MNEDPADDPDDATTSAESLLSEETIERLATMMNVSFSLAAHRFFMVNGLASQFAAVSAHGITFGASGAGSEMKSFVAKEFSDVPEYASLIEASDEWWSEGLKANAADVAAAAVLIIKHGALDELLNALCSIVGSLEFMTVAEEEAWPRQDLDCGGARRREAHCSDLRTRQRSHKRPQEQGAREEGRVSDGVCSFEAWREGLCVSQVRFGPTPVHRRSPGHKAAHEGVVEGLSAHQEPDSEYLFEVALLMLVRLHSSMGLVVSGNPLGFK